MNANEDVEGKQKQKTPKAKIDQKQNLCKQKREEKIEK